MAFVHDHHRFQVAQHLDQRRIRRVGQQHAVIPEKLRKAKQVPILLIDLPNIAVPAVDPQRAVAQYADRQHLPHGVRTEILSVEQLVLGVDAHPAGKVPVQPLPVGMVHVGQVFDRLLENGIAGHQPNHDLLPAYG